jgi:hypothetical protein
MKRQLISLTIILPLLSLSSTLEVYAQGGAGELPGTKPAQTSKPKAGPRDTRSPSPSASHTPAIPILAFGEGRNGRLDPKTSDKNADGSYYEEMILKAKSEDCLTFHVEGDNPLLGLQILDKNYAEVPVAKDPSGDFKINTPTKGLPADGEYRVRVTGVLIGRSASPFTINVNRHGLTTTAYVDRFQNINANYRKEDPVSVVETVAKLEALGRDNPSRSTAFELLGIIHLDVRKDIENAEAAMERALKANGAAVFQISFDNQWRRMARSKSGVVGFEETRSGWLKIGPGKLTITDLSGTTLGTVYGEQIKELSKTLVGEYAQVTITLNNTRKTYVFASKTKAEAETDMVMRLIQNHVKGKTY